LALLPCCCRLISIGCWGINGNRNHVRIHSSYYTDLHRVRPAARAATPSIDCKAAAKFCLNPPRFRRLVFSTMSPSHSRQT
jgi:hypothetical protein